MAGLPKRAPQDSTSEGSVAQFCKLCIWYHRSEEVPLAREQRRLAAIVAADVVGYSRLMGRDETGTLVRLRAHRKLSPIHISEPTRLLSTSYAVFWVKKK